MVILQIDMKGRISMLLSLIRSQNFDIISVIIYIISVLIVIFLVNPLHECAHGFVAYKLGDNTAKNQGRLTLNPIAHIDYMGALLMLLVGFGWAKPVPVNARNFKNPKTGMAITALAGPVSNFLAAVVFGLCYNGIITILVASDSAIVIGSSVLISNNMAFIEYVLMFFQFLIFINISLAVFNLIPIPPLDGSKILMAFLSDRTIYKLYQYQMYFSLALFILIMMGGMSKILFPLQNWFYGGINWLTSLPFSWAW